MQLIIYATRIAEDENFKVDSLEDYLSSIALKKQFTCQYFDNTKLDVEVKIKANSKENCLTTIDLFRYNYARTQLESHGLPNKIFYYYIREIIYVAEQTYRIKMHLDVINTFYDRIAISPLTHITRQHKDRYKRSFYISRYFYFPKIDEYSEGIIPKLYRTSERIIYDKVNEWEYQGSFYLAFMTRENPQQDDTPLVYLYVDDDTSCPITIKYESVTPVIYDRRFIFGISALDMQNSRLIKVIKIPYLPAHALGTEEYNNHTHLIISNKEWVVDSGGLIYRSNYADIAPFINKDEDSKLGTLHIDTTLLNPLMDMNMDNVTKELTQMRSDFDSQLFHEPKLLHSDFFYSKFVYDSFVKIVKNESYLNFYATSGSYYINTNGNIAFVFTSTINSKFLFEFRFFDQWNFNEEDYERYLVIGRNNEQTIYTNEYLNYLKSGYNYDIKAKNQQETFSWFTTGLGLTAGLASVAFGSKTLGVAMISSSVMSIANSINTTITAERNMEQKIAQYKLQSSSVYGSDDVDLMTYYNRNNKLWLTYYEVSNRMKKILKDLFYYTGYIDDVNEIPVTNTRMWFNYLQCELVFLPSGQTNYNIMSKENKDELIAKFKGGVTFLHMNEINSVKTWDFARTRENWERIFFN